MSEDYIRTARAKGLPERTVIARHGMRGALTPIVTMLGLDLGTLLGGLFITEALFGLPGIGALAVDSMGPARTSRWSWASRCSAPCSSRSRT